MLSKAIESGACDWVDVAKYASHNCKWTQLYWAILSNLDLDTRRLLGNHTVKADGSWLAYSVEAMRALVNKLVAVYAKVDSGELLEDQVVLDEPSGVGRKEAESGDGSGSSYTDASGEDEKELAAIIAEDAPSEESPPNVELELYRHRKYGTHNLRKIRDLTDQARFVCGRPLSDSFSALAGWPSPVVRHCAACYLSGVASRLGL